MTGYEQLELADLRTRAFGRPARHYSLTDSTNQRLLDWAAEGAPHGSSCIADAQSFGRGRQGRTWSSEPGSGLYASLLLRPQRSFAGVASFSLVVALSVARALRELGVPDVQLKWPNDLWWRGRKLAGILLEARGGVEPVIVVGLGLNMRAPAGGWPRELEKRAISLEEGEFPPPAPERIWTAVLNQLEPSWELYCVEGFAAFQQDWRAADLLMGCVVDIEEGERRFRAQVEGVDPGGRLMIHVDGESPRALEAGEVHLGLEEKP